MAFERMSAEDQAVIGDCLKAAPVFLDSDLDTVTGVDEETFEAIAAAYPSVDDSNEDVALAIHGALLNMVFYPHSMEKKWSQFIRIPREEIPAVHARWMHLKGWDVPEADSPGELYFKLMR
ncbi:hypothetical protein V3W47_02700 [Deinococcus sp. YIM 134068]|uniref:hypothetical protein n=1 Tax=Deinococcus lichenicola TaxID=3118910 RepID=UPI002F933FE9